jgi:aminoglycoside phosphotransferase (APT) family kinase protein
MTQKRQPFRIKGIATLAPHLNTAYGIDVAAMTELDLGVIRVDRHDGPSWVARVFPRSRTVEDVRRDAVVLERLEQGGFPAERVAAPDPASTHEEQTVLVTEFIAGERPRSGGRTFAYLGGLLGALHSRDGVNLSPGGGWHHLVSSGAPSDEVRAAQTLLSDLAPSVAPADGPALKALAKAVSDIDTCEDLPHCFVHPDMVPMNAVEKDDGSIAIVDWTNAGRGPRLWSLGMSLFAAGVRDARLVEKLVSRYVKWSSLEPEELDRLDGAIRARPLTIHAWEIVYGRKPLSESVQTIRFLNKTSAEIAAAARASFAIPRES